jgi:hypothetical protein
MNTETDQRSGKIGAGWMNTDGTVSLRLDEGVVIKEQRGVIFTLFHVKDKDIEREKRRDANDSLGVTQEPFDQRKKW